MHFGLRFVKQISLKVIMYPFYISNEFPWLFICAQKHTLLLPFTELSLCALMQAWLFIKNHSAVPSPAEEMESWK